MDMMQPNSHSLDEIKEIIPVIEGLLGSQEQSVIEQTLAYLDNPCVVEVMYKSKETGEIYGTPRRLALGLRSYLDTRMNAGIEMKGIDYDVMMNRPAKGVLAGITIANEEEARADEVYRYLGRLSEIIDSENPPQRENLQNLFQTDKDSLTKSN